MTGFGIEVDETSCEKLELMDAPTNSMVIKGREAFIAAVPPSNFGYVTIKVSDLELESSQVQHAFRKWRLILRDAEREHELFAKTA